MFLGTSCGTCGVNMRFELCPTEIHGVVNNDHKRRYRAIPYVGEEAATRFQRHQPTNKITRNVIKKTEPIIFRLLIMRFSHSRTFLQTEAVLRRSRCYSFAYYAFRWHGGRIILEPKLIHDLTKGAYFRRTTKSLQNLWEECVRE